MVIGLVDRQRTSFMRQLFEKACEMKTAIFAVCADFAKAFDSVDRGLPWEILPHQGVPPKLLNALKNLHRNMEGHVSYRGELSKISHEYRS